MTMSHTPRHGVDTPKLLATIGHVAEMPELAAFTFRATNRWIRGTRSRTTFGPFSGAGSQFDHVFDTTFDADHPQVLCGEGAAPTPPEFLLHALASCIMAGIANIAAARRVTLHEVTIEIAGDLDLQGMLGIRGDVRNGYSEMRLNVNIAGDADQEKLLAIVEQAKARSAVLDALTNGVAVRVEGNAA
ncbi:MAG: OsmC family peroxiredoxin [Deltaproteobacteria bacterium]|nr:MAG: OsmC family peroxiredoxin [Deltaproteobacteria bacterium]